MFQKVLFKEQLQKLMGDSTTTEFAERTGFNRTYLSKYLNLRLDRPPSPDLLKSIAGPQVSYEDLMISCGYLPAETFSPSHSVRIPILGAVHAGLPAFAVENIEGYESVDTSEVSPCHSYFYLRVQGDSMINARIYPNDLVFVRKQTDVESGDIAVVIIDNDTATLKRVLKKDGLFILQAENPAYAPMVFTAKDADRLQIIGKVLHVKFKL
ncbi:MAG TPA: hypothetical protein H9733_02715 [Candidatus Anaerotignum merdipullorum]|nr:hypothetical protein [Candidatus Anaerotignum merdipullorum]